MHAVCMACEHSAPASVSSDNAFYRELHIDLMWQNCNLNRCIGFFVVVAWYIMSIQQGFWDLNVVLTCVLHISLF